MLLAHPLRPMTQTQHAAVPWLAGLEPLAQTYAVQHLQALHVPTGDYVFRIGQAPTHWFGLLDGLLKMHNDEGDRDSLSREALRKLPPPITFTGVAPGGWFGEGTLLKNEAYRYNIQALRASVVGVVKAPAYRWLLDNSIAFNRTILSQMNERLSQFIAAREIDRLTDPTQKVARGLASLFNPALYPNVSQTLKITQQELAYLVGLSRQRVNEALSQLVSRRLIVLEYGGVRVMDLPALRGM